MIKGIFLENQYRNDEVSFTLSDLKTPKEWAEMTFTIETFWIYSKDGKETVYQIDQYFTKEKLVLKQPNNFFNVEAIGQETGKKGDMQITFTMEEDLNLDNTYITLKLPKSNVMYKSYLEDMKNKCTSTLAPTNTTPCEKLNINRGDYKILYGDFNPKKLIG